MKKETGAVLRDIEQLLQGPAGMEKGASQGPASARPGAAESRGNALYGRESQTGDNTVRSMRPGARQQPGRRGQGPQMYEALGSTPRPRRAERPTGRVQRRGSEAVEPARGRRATPAAEGRGRTQEPATGKSLDPEEVLREADAVLKGLPSWREQRQEQDAAAREHAAQGRDAQLARLRRPREVQDHEFSVANGEEFHPNTVGNRILYIRQLNEEAERKAAEGQNPEE